MKSYKKLPSLKELELVRGRIKSIRNKRGEFKRKVHYGCYLLCSESGLRISEAEDLIWEIKPNKTYTE